MLGSWLDWPRGVINSNRSVSELHRLLLATDEGHISKKKAHYVSWFALEHPHTATITIKLDTCLVFDEHLNIFLFLS